MGLCFSSVNVNERTRIIDKKIKADKFKRKTEVKLLLLGKNNSSYTKTINILLYSNKNMPPIKI